MSLSERVRPGVEAAPWVVQEITTLEAKVRELEAERDAYKLVAEGEKLDAYQAMQEELTASRQQVERLVEALKDLRSVVRHLWNDDDPEIFALDAACEKADEDLAAVKKERENE